MVVWIGSFHLTSIATAIILGLRCWFENAEWNQSDPENLKFILLFFLQLLFEGWFLRCQKYDKDKFKMWNSFCKVEIKSSPKSAV